MRLPGSEKLEIIRLVEQSHLPARRTLEMLGIRPSTFYRTDGFQSTTCTASAEEHEIGFLSTNQGMAEIINRHHTASLAVVMIRQKKRLISNV